MIFVIKLAFFSLHSPNVKLRSDIKRKVSTYKNILQENDCQYIQVHVRCHVIWEKTLSFKTKSHNKEQMVETRGRTKSLHGKRFPTASQFQGKPRFEERGWHQLLGLIGIRHKQLKMWMTTQFCRQCKRWLL